MTTIDDSGNSRRRYSRLMADPYPGKTFEQALQALKSRYPAGDIDYQPVGGDVFITLPLTDGGEFRAALTWEQAKFVAFGQVTGDELKAEQFPKVGRRASHETRPSRDVCPRQTFIPSPYGGVRDHGQTVAAKLNRHRREQLLFAG